MGGADGFAQDGAGSGFAKPALDLVEVGELAEDPGDEARGLVLRFEKFPTDVCQRSPKVHHLIITC